MTFPWLHRRALLLPFVATLACTTWSDGDHPVCPRGQQSVDGHCLPTPSIVFQRCMEAFRTSSIEHDRSRDLAVSASLEQRGGSFQREHKDRERREYDGLATDDLSVAIGECRRQEEAERAGQIARAWEDAERARTDAEQARLEAVGARTELRRTTAKLERLEEATARKAAKDEARQFADLPTVAGSDPEIEPIVDDAGRPASTADVDDAPRNHDEDEDGFDPVYADLE